MHVIKKRIIQFLFINLFCFVLFSHEITDKSIYITDKNSNDYFLGMDFNKVEDFLGTSQNIIYSTDFVDLVSGYSYDGIKFYITKIGDFEIVTDIVVTGEIFKISNYEFVIGTTKLNEVKDFFDISNGKVYSNYNSKQLILACTFDASMYASMHYSESLRKSASYQINLYFDSETLLLEECDVFIDF